MLQDLSYVDCDIRKDCAHDQIMAFLRISSGLFPWKGDSDF